MVINDISSGPRRFRGRAISTEAIFWEFQCFETLFLNGSIKITYATSDLGILVQILAIIVPRIFTEKYQHLLCAHCSLLMGLTVEFEHKRHSQTSGTLFRLCC